MKKQVTYLSVHQVSKLVGLVHFLLAGMLCFPVAILTYLMTRKIEYFTIGLIPFAAWLAGYVLAAMVAGIYNFAARNIGGVEYYTAEVD